MSRVYEYNSQWICYMCNHIFKENEPSWYDKETENHICDDCVENKQETEGEEE